MKNNNTNIKRFTVVGVTLIVLGIAAILTPAIAGSAIVLTIGLILLAAGAIPIIRALQSKDWLEKALGITLGVITALAGIAVIGHPLFGLAFLTMLLLVYFIIEGCWKISVAIRYRPAAGWRWLMLSGVLTLVLGLMIWRQWPMSGLWAVGVLVGVNLFGTGISLVTLASSLKR